MLSRSASMSSGWVIDIQSVAVSSARVRPTSVAYLAFTSR